MQSRVQSSAAARATTYTHWWSNRTLPLLHCCRSGFAASCRPPLRSVRLLAELRAPDQLLTQVLRVIDLRRDHDPRGAVELAAIEELSQRRLLAVRHAVLLQIAGPHLPGDHSQRRRPVLAGAAN